MEAGSPGVSGPEDPLNAGAAALPGFVSAQWMIGEDGTGMSVMVFETRDAAEALAERLRSGAAPPPAGLRFDAHDVVEVFLAV